MSWLKTGKNSDKKSRKSFKSPEKYVSLFENVVIFSEENRDVSKVSTKIQISRKY